jgi:hypothetical protein
MDHVGDVVIAATRRRVQAIVCCAIFGVALLLSASGHAMAATDLDHVLSRGFIVYSDDRIVAKHPADGLTPRRVPVWNRYRGRAGGYVACYSHDLALGAYRVASDIAVVGLVRLKGNYQGRIFQPEGYRDRDISAVTHFREICGRALKSCRGDRCWAGGDTGGFAGE